MKPFVPSIIHGQMPFAALTQAYQMREQQQRAAGLPTFSSLFQEAGQRAGLQSLPSTEIPMMEEELKQTIPEEIKQEVVANLSQRPVRNEHIELPEIDYDEEARLIQEENPDIQPEQLQEIVQDLRQEDDQNRQDIDLLNRIADQIQANEPEFRQSMAMQILSGAVSLVTFDQGLKILQTSYDVFRDEQARNNLQQHDQVQQNELTQEELKEAIKTAPKAAQCKRHVWMSPKSGQLRSLLVCTDKYGIRNYMNR